MAKKPETSSRIADNKKAAFNYFFEERHEAGMVLHGWEVKALRSGKVQLTDGYVLIKDGELFLLGCQINPLKTASTQSRLGTHQEAALEKDEIKRLSARSSKRAIPWCPSICTGRTVT
jgi:SsrA-binding protein